MDQNYVIPSLLIIEILLGLKPDTGSVPQDEKEKHHPQDPQQEKAKKGNKKEFSLSHSHLTC